ncbi:MAG: hypothetical protein IJO85_07450 [Lachnospiraceae bacterium]|nr:hypothetical protein [Lachnospiraceae bacterium]
MTVSTLALEKLCSTGCSIVLNFSDCSAISLEKLVSLTKKSNGHITIKNCQNASSLLLEKLATLGKEHITIDFTN